MTAFAGLTHAQSTPSNPTQFTPFKGDGYYWYKVDPATQPASSPKPPQSASTAKPGKPEPLSVKWLRENMPVLLDQAVDNPTTENVANYMYAQRVLLDKSQNFSSQVKDVVATDPFLDENNRIPLSQYAQTAFLRQVKSNEQSILSVLAERGGIWLFTDKPERCMACKTYEDDVLIGRSGLIGFVKEFNFPYRSVNVSTEEGKNAAQRLGLKVTPTTIFVAPPNKYILISQGLMSQDKLRERLLIGARIAGVLTPEEATMTQPYNKGLLQNKDITLDADKVDPAQVMTTLRNHIKGSQ